MKSFGLSGLRAAEGKVGNLKISETESERLINIPGPLRTSNSNNRSSLFRPSVFSSQQQADKNIQDEQDRVLDDMQVLVSNLSNVGRNIGSELQTQAGMLSEMDEEVTHTLSSLELVETRIESLLHKKGISHCRVIICLSGIALFLLFLVVYT